MRKYRGKSLVSIVRDAAKVWKRGDYVKKLETRLTMINQEMWAAVSRQRNVMTQRGILE